jgi:hypothetical protein
MNFCSWLGVTVSWTPINGQIELIWWRNVSGNIGPDGDHDDTLVVQRNIAKAMKQWVETWWILGSKPILPKTFVCFYKAVVMNVLLYSFCTAARYIMESEW